MIFSKFLVEQLSKKSIMNKIYIFIFIALIFCITACNKKLNPGEIPLEWSNNLTGDFSFKDKWSLDDFDESDTTHYFHSIESEAWTYEWGGTDFIKVERLNEDTVFCYTLNNAATHSSLNLTIGRTTVKPTIVLNSIRLDEEKTCICKGGKMVIDKKFWDAGILKAAFDFNFLNDEDSMKMYWKGKIYAKICTAFTGVSEDILIN